MTKRTQFLLGRDTVPEGKYRNDANLFYDNMSLKIEKIMPEKFDCQSTKFVSIFV